MKKIKSERKLILRAWKKKFKSWVLVVVSAFVKLAFMPPHHAKEDFSLLS